MKCAYVTLVMLGDSYVKGAVALAKSLIKSGTKHELVCLITKDVTQRQKLQQLYNHVIIVPYLYFECGKMLTERQQQLYNKWINFSFTKWRCFELISYDKCVYLDADQLVLRNIDHLFCVASPCAMCFNYNYNPQYKLFKYGHTITPTIHNHIIHNYDIIGFTGTLVFTPNMNLFEKIVSLLNPKNPLLNTPVNKYNNGFDEIVLAQALINLKLEVTQLSPMYMWNAGDYSVLRNLQPYIINYYGDQKPWTTNGGNKTEHSQFMDVYIWKYFYNSKIK
ncbi:p13 [Matsumuraeses phaseoli granulovirus]|uniref:P13 n=1 Tax=Matsumuraeses phaseoli granulovirus TaxID=2760664 RepID=A0AAE7SYP5_9BBAC|nr:p13 [Matsumuraeses phaseoli granulovirus]QOD40002.1 p13 [Matsumuraeses phaseoli granulovirus]